jgi:hypothetical protein
MGVFCLSIRLMGQSHTEVSKPFDKQVIDLRTRLPINAEISNPAAAVFSKVWDQIASDPYVTLPHNKVSVLSFGPLLGKITAAAKRTIENKKPILPSFTKLVHANGICFSGTWNITEPTDYTGYFKTGAKGLIIARASSATSDVDQGKYRAFGIAGRIFPTDDETEKIPLESANFFTIDDLGGTLSKHFTDQVFSNAPPLSARLALIPFGLATARAFSLADKNPAMRQVYEIAELGLNDRSQAKSPKRMHLVFEDGQTFDAKDFRDELRLKNHGGKLRLKIMVSDDKESKNMKQIGFVEFTKDAASESCDTRFHVSHPIFQEKYEKD